VGFVGILRTETGRIRTGWRVLLFFLLFSVFLVLFSLIPLEGVNWETLPFLLSCLCAGWVLLGLDGRGPGALGFFLSSEVPREAILGLVMGVAVGLAVVVGMFILGGVRWTSEAGQVSGFVTGGLLSLWFFTLPAAAEVALFRGYLLQARAERWGSLAALWVTSILFGLIHLGNPNTSTVGIGNIVMAGLFLGALYLKTASLWWASAAHLGWNWTLGFLADVPVSGLELVDSPLYEGVPQGGELISGGDFGPEGSLVATVGLALAAYLVWKSPRLKPGQKALEVRPLIVSAVGTGPSPRESEGYPEHSDVGREE
jgi:membrane protease YdiL (CAAX protease family)